MSLPPVRPLGKRDAVSFQPVGISENEDQLPSLAKKRATKRLAKRLIQKQIALQRFRRPKKVGVAKAKAALHVNAAVGYMSHLSQATTARKNAETLMATLHAKRIARGMAEHTRETMASHRQTLVTQEGDLTMYTTEMIRKRKKIRKEPRVVEMIGMIWDTFHLQEVEGEGECRLRQRGNLSSCFVEYAHK
jgi:hypothetical protein